MKIINKSIFATCLAVIMIASSFAGDVGVKGERVWIQRSCNAARCNNIEGFIDIAELGEVKKADVEKLTISSFAMDYLFKQNRGLDSNNRNIYAYGTFAAALAEYTKLRELVIENIIDTYEEDTRKDTGTTTKVPYEEDFCALFSTAQRNLIVTIENINLLKTNLKNVRTIIQNSYGAIVRIMPEGLKTVNVATTWTEDVLPDRFDLSGSAETLTSVFINRFDALSTGSFIDVCDGCANLTDFIIKIWNAPKAISFGHMFNECTALTNVEIGSLNAPSALEFDRMFSECPLLTKFSLGSWCVLSALNTASIEHLFFRCPQIKAPAAPNWEDPD